MYGFTFLIVSAVFSKHRIRANNLILGIYSFATFYIWRLQVHCVSTKLNFVVGIAFVFIYL
jgi:hypothetical protein